MLKFFEGLVNKDVDANLDVLQALSQEYLCTVIVNIVTGAYQIHTVPNELEHLVDYGRNGHSYYEVFEQYVQKYIFVEDRNALLSALSLDNIKSELKHSQSISIMARRVSGNGSLKYIRIEARRIDSNDMGRFLFAAKDIDAEVRHDQERQAQLQKAYETAERASLAKNQFMHNMSHDIRTPLNAIVGYTTVAVDHIDDPKLMEKYLGRIEDAGQHLLHIINEILDLGELEEGNIRLTESVITMEELVTQISDTLGSQIRDKQLNFVIENNDKENKALVMDAFHVSRVLINLLSNAAKFNEVGGTVKLTINPSEGMEPGMVHYTFIVEDTGIGISEEFLSRVFVPFEREKTSTQSRKKGVGIGLSIVKNIVEALGGSVYAKSKVGEGSTFTVELQFEYAPTSEQEREARASRPAAENPIADKRILVVDDSKVNRDIAMAILDSFGAIVECASDGDDSIDMIKASEENYYDLVLMDIQMPRMDGHEATKHIRELERVDVKKMPIIALTADVFDDTRKQAEAVGMDDFLTKPINVKAMRETLERHL